MVIRKKQASIALLASCLMLDCAIAGCTKTELPGNARPQTTPPAVVASPATSKDLGVQRWATILKGDSLQDLTFTNDGKLLYQNNVLLKKVPVSYVSNGNVTYAQRLIVSDPSPLGRFKVIRACESPTNETGLCWAVFLLDRQLRTAKKIGIAKYGGQEWVKWTTDERYAVFAESMEGVT